MFNVWCVEMHYQVLFFLTVCCLPSSLQTVSWLWSWTVIAASNTLLVYDDTLRTNECIAEPMVRVRRALKRWHVSWFVHWECCRSNITPPVPIRGITPWNASLGEELFRGCVVLFCSRFTLQRLMMFNVPWEWSLQLALYNFCIPLAAYKNIFHEWYDSWIYCRLFHCLLASVSLFVPFWLLNSTLRNLYKLSGIRT